jgi:hypothetical protein
MSCAAYDVYEVNLLMRFVLHVSNLSCRRLVSQSVIAGNVLPSEFLSVVSDLIKSLHSVTGLSTIPCYSDFCIYLPSLLFSSVSVILPGIWP